MYNEYQILSESFFDKSYKITKRLTDSILDIAQSENASSDVIDIAHDFSLNAFENSEYSDAVFYSNLSLKHKRELQQLDQEFITILYRVGVFNQYNSSFETAVKHYNEVIKYNIDPVRTAQSYCEIAIYYHLMDDYYKSINFHNKGIKELERLKLYDRLPREYINLSSTYKEVGSRESLESMLKTLNKLKTLEQYNVLDTTNYINLNMAFARYYAHEFNYDFEKAKFYSEESLELSINDNREDFSCYNYINLANIYNIQKLDSAKYYSEKAIKNCSDIESLTKSYFQLGDYFNNKSNYIKALESIQESINLLIRSDNNYNHRLSLNELLKSDDKNNLLFMLYEKIKLLHKNNQAKLALQHVLVSDSLVNDIQSNNSYTSKLHWRTKAAEIYTKGAEISYLLNNEKIAFNLSEKGKALLLNEGIIQNAEFTKLPDSITQKELTLRKKSLEITTQEQIFEAELQYENYIDSISKIFPEYFKKLNFQNTITLEDAKKKLDSNTVAISYLWPNKEEDSSYVYALFINKKETKLVQIEKADVLTKTINTYKNIISKPFKSQKDREDYILVAHKLYKILFPDNYKGVFDKKKLVIIPDGNLHNIPFEALITDIESKDYLIESNSINYEYSLSFSHYNSTLTRETSKDFIGYAPENFNTELKLNDLNNTSSELNAISKNINGDILTKKLATKSSFLEQSKDYKIIHLATHANATETPWIAFKDEKVSLNELYTYKNNAELTVLSACESSTGEIATGEGVMSLARGFFYSGSNAVLASLWNANDKSTSFLMEEFYKHLKKGKSKSEALRTAKLNYLKTHSLSETSPYYWSSFVLIGDPSSIDFTPNYNIVYSILIILLVLIFSLIYLKRKKI